MEETKAVEVTTKNNGFKAFFNKNNIRIRSLTNLIGIALMFVAGLAFVLFVDLKAKIQAGSNNIVPISNWLFMCIIFSLGGGIFYFFGDTMKNKKVLTLILKGIGLVLAIGFIVYIFVFLNWVTTSDIIKVEAIGATKSTAYASLVITILGVLTLIINYILSIIFLDDEY